MQLHPLRTLALAALALAASAAPAAAGSTIRNFHSPSGNIRCEIDNLTVWNVRCDISHHTYRAPRKPASCPGDWGDSVYMHGRSRARFLCHGDAVDAGSRLAYGRTIRLGPFRCTSRTTGMYCRNAVNHGWRLSAQVARLV